MATIDTLTINIDTNANAAIKDLDSLTGALRRVGAVKPTSMIGASNTRSALKATVDVHKAAAKAINSCWKTAGKTLAWTIPKKSFELATKSVYGFGQGLVTVTKYFNPFTVGVVKLGNTVTKTLLGIAARFLTVWTLIRGLIASVNLNSQLTELNNLVYTVFGEYADKVEDLARTSTEMLGMNEISVKQVASNFQQLGTSLGIAQGDAADMSIELTKLAANMTSMFNEKDVNTAATKLRAIFTGQARPMQAYGIDLKVATMEQYLLSQGIQKSWSAMTQAEKAAYRYQYVMQKLGYVSGDFAKTSDTWANSTRTLKENFKSLGTVMGGLITGALRPLVVAMNKVMAKAISFAKTVLDAIGAIFGWKVQVSSAASLTDDLSDAVGDVSDGLDDASSGAGGTADGLGNAAKNAEKLKRTILGFDELNVLSDPNTGSSGSSGGSGGGSGGGGSATDGGVDVQITHAENAWEKYTSNIKTMEELGNLIGTSIKKGLDGIKWDKIRAKAYTFSKNLASLLNGVIRTPGLFESIGTSFAEVINTHLWSRLVFATTFDFETLGKGLSSAVVSAVNGIHWGTALANTKAWASGIATTLNGFLSKDMFDSVGTFIANTLNNSVQGAITFGLKFNFGDVGKNLSSGIVTALQGFDWESIKEAANIWAAGIGDAISGILSVDLFSEVGNFISNSLNTVLSSALTLNDHIEFDKIGTGLAAGVQNALNIDWPTALQAARNWGDGAARTINSFLTYDTFKSIGTTVVGFINTSISAAAGFIGRAELGNIARNLSNAVVDSVNGIDWDTKMSNASKIGEKIAEAINNFITPDSMRAVGTVLAKSINSVTTSLGATGENIGFHRLGSSIADGFNQALQDFDATQLATTVSSWAKGALSSIATFLQDADWELVGNKLAEYITNLDWAGVLTKAYSVIWNAIKAPFELIKGIITTIAPDTLLEDLSTWLDGILEKIPLLTTLCKTYTDFFNLVKDVVVGTGNYIFGETVDGDFLNNPQALYRAIEYIYKNGDKGIEHGNVSTLKSYVESGNTDLVEGFVNSLMKGYGISNSEISSALNNINSGMSDTSDTANAASDALDNYGSAVDNASKAQEDAAKSGRKVQVLNGKTVQTTNEAAASNRSLADSVNRTSSVVSATASTIQTYGINVGKAGEGSGVLAGTLGKVGDVAGVVSGKVGSVGTASGAASGIVGTFSGKVKAGATWLKKLFTGSEDAADGMTGIANSTSEASTEMGKYPTVVEEAIASSVSAVDAGSDKMGAGGKKTTESFVLGADSKMALVTQIGNDLVETVIKELDKRTDALKGYGEKMIEGLAHGLSNNSSTGSISSTMATISDKIKAVPSYNEMYQIGAKLMQGLADGVKSIKLPSLTVYRSGDHPDYITDGTGKRTVIRVPDYAIRWAAKGGLFDGAQVIGVGEAGQEAVLPLENQRTMQNIANAITSQMSGGDIQDAVYRGTLAANQANGTQPVIVTLQGDAKALFRSVQKQGAAYEKSTGRGVFA